MTIAGRLIAGILALIAIGVSGPGLVNATLPVHARPGIRRGLVILLGLCLGVSLWAAVGLTAFFIHKSSPPALMAGDAALSIIAGIAILCCRRANKDATASIVECDSSERVSPSMLCLLFLAIAGSAAIFALQVHQRHDGGYDAWAIWNVRARFIFARSPHTFDATFPHADYSPLWPALLARIGWLMGGLSTTTPIVCAASAAVLNAGVLLLGVAWFRGLPTGVLAAIVLLGTQEFVVHAADQYADVPLACVLLPAGVMLAIFLDSRSKPRSRLAILAGMLGAIGALVKNEGIIYLLGLFAGLIVAIVRFPAPTGNVFIVVRSKIFRPTASATLHLPRGSIGVIGFIAGAVPMLLLLGVFKIAFAPPNDLISGGAAFAVAHDVNSLPLINESDEDIGRDGKSKPDAGSEVRRRAGSKGEESGSSDYLRTGVPGKHAENETVPPMQAPPTLARRLTDIHRYRFVFVSVLNRIFIRLDRWNIFLLAAVVSFFVRPRTIQDKPARTALGVAIVITCIGYFFAYITTPHGLKWHVETSMNRLILQIWGSLVFLIAMRLTDIPDSPRKKGEA